MKLKCPACGTPIASSNINVRTMTVVCDHCDNVFTFGTDVEHKPKTELTVSPDIFIAPPQVTIYDAEPKQLHFSFKWDWRTEPPLAITITVGFMVAYLIGLGRLLTPLYFLITLPIALYILYYFLGLATNRTYYQVKRGRLYIHTAPFWFPAYGHKELALDEVKDINASPILALKGDTTQALFYNVMATRRNGSSLLLARGVNYAHAQFIVQELLQAVSVAQRASGSASLSPRHVRLVATDAFDVETELTDGGEITLVERQKVKH